MRNIAPMIINVRQNIHSNVVQILLEFTILSDGEFQVFTAHSIKDWVLTLAYVRLCPRINYSPLRFKQASEFWNIQWDIIWVFYIQLRTFLERRVTLDKTGLYFVKSSSQTFALFQDIKFKNEIGCSLISNNSSPTSSVLSVAWRISYIRVEQTALCLLFLCVTVQLVHALLSVLPQTRIFYFLRSRTRQTLASSPPSEHIPTFLTRCTLLTSLSWMHFWL